uniref:tRNA-dihydrouridine(47) synthase [NAD(P)(+)] n=1 Tax=Globodera pallida TaxID=36090 RepID=A0A183BQ81_GLOPA
MSKAVQLVTDNFNVDFVDLNLGCPLDSVNEKGAGCSLANKSNKLVSVLQCMQKSAGGVPLSVKMRYGMKEGEHTAHYTMGTIAEKSPPQMVTLHPRSREQRYTKAAEWPYVLECERRINGRFPFFVCGDVMDYEEYYQRLEEYPIDGIMIGRAALIKPWIFTEIDERRRWDITSLERFEFIRKFVNYGLENWGSDVVGVENTRRYLLEWLSFQHRYIPVGLLEVLPQQINHRPPLYRGRDELESLLSSPASSDWIRISEMLLGKVPEGFLFVPKHNANAF